VTDKSVRGAGTETKFSVVRESSFVQLASQQILVSV